MVSGGSPNEFLGKFLYNAVVADGSRAYDLIKSKARKSNSRLRVSSM